MRASLPPLDARFAHGEAHMYTGARLALNNPQLVAGAGDHPEPQPEPRAVISRRHADAVVCDQDPDATAPRRHAAGNRRPPPPAVTRRLSGPYSIPSSRSR